LLLFAVGSTARIPGSQALPFLSRLAVGFGLALIAPALNFISLLIPNAAVLLFPSWFQTGKDAPTGIEATGQRLIFVFGQILVMAIALLAPAGIALLIIYFGKTVFGFPGAISIAAILASMILIIEGSIGLILLGKFFEQFDLSAESTG